MTLIHPKSSVGHIGVFRNLANIYNEAFSEKSSRKGIMIISALKANSSFIEWKHVSARIPQRLIQEALLFGIFLNIISFLKKCRLAGTANKDR